MQIRGSCQCEKVKYRVESETPEPYQFCYCSICRKTTGGAYGCNIMGKRETLHVTGKKFLQKYHAVIREKGKRPRRSGAERWFCKNCGTHLYLLDREYPSGVWPNAGSVDTELPVPKSRVQMMLEFKPDWVPALPKGPRFAGYPKLSIADWHKKHGRHSSQERS